MLFYVNRSGRMKRIKGVLYNNVPETLIAIGILLISILFFDKNIIGTYLVLVALLLLIFNFLWNEKINKSLSYFKCRRSFFIPNCIWINQKTFIKNNGKCPQKEFVKDLKSILSSIPNGTICYCCTHELIKEHIEKHKHIKNVMYTYCYTKDLKKLKKRLKTNACNKCFTKKCSLLKKDKTHFYSVKFVKLK